MKRITRRITKKNQQEDHGKDPKREVAKVPGKVLVKTKTRAPPINKTIC